VAGSYSDERLASSLRVEVFDVGGEEPPVAALGDLGADMTSASPASVSRQRL
jgi:hypothetical protein